MNLSVLPKKAGSMLNRSRTVSALVALLSVSALMCSATNAGAASGPLDAQMETMKSEVLRLNRDLVVLQEELQAPAGTEVSVFLSLQGGKQLDLDSVQVLIDGKPVATQLYTAREVQALVRGGVQRLYTGSLRTGEHTLVAYFTGKGTRPGDYKRGTTFKFTKASSAKVLEVQIKDASAKSEPEFGVKVWQ
jgi:hypothetical protein